MILRKCSHSCRGSKCQWYHRSNSSLFIILLFVTATVFIGITRVQSFQTTCSTRRITTNYQSCYKRISEYIALSAIKDIEENQRDENEALEPFASMNTRRKVLVSLMASGTLLSVSPQTVNAGKAEIDSKTGELFSPKSEMLGGGGSDLARGIKLESRTKGEFATDGGPVQYVYETRFITYLSRFLLNYDPAAKAWWNDQDFGVDERISVEVQKKIRFAEFAESVEIGLANYFVGPYGSYASVQAAKAGLLAKAPAQSSSFDVAKTRTSLFDSISQNLKRGDSNSFLVDRKAGDKAKQGILNLFSLLQARYTSVECKRQLVILFSLISDPKLQPTREIKGILGEADDGTVSKIEITGRLENGDNYRLSGRRGGGYSVYEQPKAAVESPPALGALYSPAKIEVITKPTSRVLRIRVLDRGRGYTSSPKVEVIQQGVTLPCEAVAVLDRNGSVEDVIVLDPGFGYGRYKKRNDVPPEVRIAPPKTPRGMKQKNDYLPAIAIADLEYAIDIVKIVDGGNGYITNTPPKIELTLPSEEPDWYISPINRKTWKVDDSIRVQIQVKEMTSVISGETVQTKVSPSIAKDKVSLDPSMLENMTNDPLTLLPTTLQPYYTVPGDKIPELGSIAKKDGNFRILSLPMAVSTMFLPSRYRAYDPIFGAIGSKPVTKTAQALTGSEYTRLALSGGICTVIVRTALNPLELVKTKIQLKNDEELLQIAKKISMQEKLHKNETLTEKDANAGTVDVIRAMASTRGPSSLFQSADVTFLASSVFGSFGFGATELFRRSFTMVFFGDNGYEMRGTGEELILLFAAALACVLTSLAAAPFEMLRVRSMGYIDPKPISTVLSDYLNEKREERAKQEIDVRSGVISFASFTLSNMSKDDIPPLFSGFLPIVSRELPFAVIKFLTFDSVAASLITFINSLPQVIEPVQVGNGGLGLTISAVSGAIAGLTGAFVSHPADLVLTLTSSKQKKVANSKDGSTQYSADWKPLVRELISQEGGLLNLFTGLPARSTFFFLVIGLQFFLYDYAKNIFQVGSDDLTLVLDVFYAIRQGL
mmetsp:Transcript_12115/g.22670  ORF Transcript_12115/g.22670 Transcript_12115/m.22670 type:complete len:1052 (-) Transcript_12115:1977-5132(-)